MPNPEEASSLSELMPHDAGAALRYESLAHWRGVAALAVVLFHGFGAVRGAGVEVHASVAWLKAAADLGWFGVHLFFVISGYCIAANVLRVACAGRGAWHFVKDRMLRIYPAYWGAAMLSVAVALSASPFNGTAPRAALPADLKSLLANVLLLEPYFGVTPLLLVSWSLVFEVGFYLLVAVGLGLHARGAKLSVLLAVGVALAVAGLVGVSSGPLYLLKCWAEFVCGASIFVALWTRDRSGLWKRYALLPVVLAGIALLSETGEPHAAQMAGAALFSLLLGYLKAHDRSIADWRGLRWLAGVGSYSYSLYLVHVPIEGRVVNLLSRHIDTAGPLFLFVPLAGLGAALAFAWGFFRICEQPFERFRRRQAHAESAIHDAQSAQAGLASRHRA